MKKVWYRTSQVLIDLGVLTLAYCVAFLVRFDGMPPHFFLKKLGFTCPYYVGVEYLMLVAFGVPNFAWRYVSLHETKRILLACVLSAGAFLGARFLAPPMQNRFAYAQYALIPIGVILVNLVVSFLGVTGTRVVRRILAERVNSGGLRRTAEEVRTILIGAGQAGGLVAKEVASRPDLGIKVVGFLDDDPVKVGTVVHGIRVLGPTGYLPEVALRSGASQALITIPGGDGRTIRRIVGLCDKAGLAAKVIPGLFQLLDSKVSLSRMREVSIEDLLRREPITLDVNLVREFLTGKRVLVTGAGGSIGSELCRQVMRYQPECVVLVERSEFNLFAVHQDLLNLGIGCAVVPCICDVCDSKRLQSVFENHRPQVVFHAAAHKHVPMMEWNPGEALKNNVFGTKKVADTADAYGAEAFVLVSTDKAVNPTSIMGATKRVAEIYTQALSAASHTRFVAVRFGNVLGSAGSVVPTFKAQIAIGGPVTVTHPEMKRYFMTIPEACQLMTQAGAMGASGEILVLDMGEPVLISDLARDIIRLSGFEPDEDIHIVYTGIRPGEKLFEELGFDAEKMTKTGHSKIFSGRLAPYPLNEVCARLEGLARLTSTNDPTTIRDELKKLVPEMQLSGVTEDSASSAWEQLHPRTGDACTLNSPDKARQCGHTTR